MWTLCKLFFNCSIYHEPFPESFEMFFKDSTGSGCMFPAAEETHPPSLTALESALRTDTGATAPKPPTAPAVDCKEQAPLQVTFKRKVIRAAWLAQSAEHAKS